MTSNTDRQECACDICADELPEPTTLSAWLAQVSPARRAEALSLELSTLN